MGLLSMRRASIWCGSRMELLKFFSVPWRRIHLTSSRFLLASAVAKLGQCDGDVLMNERTSGNSGRVDSGPTVTRP